MQITGDGCKHHKHDNVWEYYFSLGKDPVTGKYLRSPKRTIHCRANTLRRQEREVDEALRAYKQELESGDAPTKPSGWTVGAYLDLYHSQSKGNMGSPLSWEREACDIAHIKALFGGIKLTELKAPAIKLAYSEAREDGRFTESELHKIHAKLRQVMEEAVKDELIAKNPCDPISVPRPASAPRESLTQDEAARLLSCLMADFDRRSGAGHSTLDLQILPHLVGVLLLLYTGMRRGEMLGLLWDNVDLAGNDIYICLQYAKDKQLRAPKMSSIRHIYLDTALQDVLVRWMALQREYLAQLGKAQTGQTPVVSNRLGAAFDPDNFNRWFRQWCVDNDFGEFSNDVVEYYDTQGRKRYKKRGYTGLTPHMLRHTQATLLIGENTDIKTVQARLGHRSVSTTLNIYAHAIKSKDREAAETFSSLIDQA